jgi:hypothetical protein
VNEYTIFSSNGRVGTLTVKAGGALGSNYGDSGYWLSDKTRFAFVVTSSTDGDTGCVYVGVITAKGFNSVGKPGHDDCGGEMLTWYASKLPRSRGRAGPVTHARGRGPAVGPVVVGNGEYDLVTSLGTTGILSLATDGSLTVTATGSDVVGHGYWTISGSGVAMAVTDGDDTNCLFLGTLGTKGINSLPRPGPYECQDTAHTWYAVRT